MSADFGELERSPLIESLVPKLLSFFSNTLGINLHYVRLGFLALGPL